MIEFCVVSLEAYSGTLARLNTPLLVTLDYVQTFLSRLNSHHLAQTRSISPLSKVDTNLIISSYFQCNFSKLIPKGDRQRIWISKVSKIVICKENRVYYLSIHDCFVYISLLGCQ